MLTRTHICDWRYWLVVTSSNKATTSSAMYFCICQKEPDMWHIHAIKELTTSRLVYLSYLAYEVNVACYQKYCRLGANIHVHMRLTLIQYSNQFALDGWSWIVLSCRVHRNVITSDLGRSYLLLTRALVKKTYWARLEVCWYIICSE